MMTFNPSAIPPGSHTVTATAFIGPYDLYDSFDIGVVKVKFENELEFTDGWSSEHTVSLSDDSWSGPDEDSTIWYPRGQIGVFYITNTQYAYTYCPSNALPNFDRLRAYSSLLPSCIDSTIIWSARISTETKAEIPKPRDRKTIGVAEVVKLEIEPKPTNFIPIWNSSDGVISNEAAVTIIYTAPNHNDNVNFTVELLGSENISCDLEVVEPENCILVNYSTQPIPPHFLLSSYSHGLRIRYDLLVAPTNVSFANVCVMESPVVSTNATGYYADDWFFRAEFLDHGKCGAGEWRKLNDQNAFSDGVQHTQCRPPFLDSYYSWPDTGAWTVDFTKTNLFVSSETEFHMKEDGTISATKFGITISCDMNGVLYTNDLSTINQ